MSWYEPDCIRAELNRFTSQLFYPKIKVRCLILCFVVDTGETIISSIRNILINCKNWYMVSLALETYENTDHLLLKSNTNKQDVLCWITEFMYIH